MSAFAGKPTKGWTVFKATEKILEFRYCWHDVINAIYKATVKTKFICICQICS